MIPMLFVAMLAAPTPAADIAGHWKTETRNGIVDIQHCGSSICGTLVTSDGLKADPGLKDKNNKDASLRGRSLKGITMLSGFTKDGDAWSNGQVYNAEDGGTYKGKLTPTDADHLSVRGCIVWPLCKTQTWTRVR
ncbi:MAG: hypothetical protein JWO65_144 [Sphingomonas bacterium]|jgi:uncharacterized protein (DUF2147 family)|nr:hypothetical protein [Sphingomonas bacterium]